MLIESGWDDPEREAFPSVFEMPYEKPRYSLNRVDKAGEAVARAEIKSADFVAAVPVFWNWRAAHAYPQNTFYVTLSRRAKSVHPDALVSQRLKRRQSVLAKLLRNSKMELSQMQDIAGCRAVMPNMADLDALLAIYQNRPVISELVKATDYISSPRESGYRGVHLMYRFSGRASAAPWNKLRVELQFRTGIQHSWATAVEAVDLFTNQRLKAEQGQPEWAYFFALVGGINAHQEGTPAVPGLPDGIEKLVEAVRDLDGEIHALESLESFGKLASVIATTTDAYWYVVVTNPAKGTVSIFSYKKSGLEEAQQHYKALEEDERLQAVLVSADSVAALERAYPAYFADTMAFVQNVRAVLARALI